MPQPRWRWHHFLLILAAYYLIGLGLAALLEATIAPSEAAATTWMIALSSAVLWLLTWAVARLRTRRAIWPQLVKPLSLRAAAQAAGAGAGLWLLMQLYGYLLLMYGIDVPSNLPEGLERQAPAMLAVLGLGLVVLAPVAEEWLFRAALYDIVGSRLSSNGLALMSGVIFGLAHGGPVQLFPVFAMIGVVLMRLYLEDANLWRPIIAHASFNLLSFLLMFV